MSYCHKCGKKTGKGEEFCAHCGAEIKDVLEEVKEKAEKIVKKTSYKGLVIFIIFLIIVGYIILDLWAMSQLTPVLSISSIAASVLNFQGNFGLSKTSIASTITIENPTFVPILFGRVSYDVKHQENVVAEGKTGFFIMAPNSQKDIPVDLNIYPLSGGLEGLKSLWNKITGNQDSWSANAYADFGIIKFKINILK